MTRFYLWVADPVELLEIAAGAHHAHNELPPAGMHRGYDATALAGIDESNFLGLKTVLYVEGTVPDGREDDWYWGTLGDFLLALPDLGESVVEKIITLAARAAGKLLGDALTIPLLKAGTRGGIMRWIRVTHRGELGGGVEQFQWKLDLGNPGADPDLTEAQRDALALQLKDIFATAWTGNSSHWDNEVQYTELGVAQITQTQATDASGQNGNQATDGVTSWAMYPATTGALQGQGLGPALPFEVALAVSLQTDHRGPSGRGRLFLPAPHVAAMDYGGVFLGALVTEASALIHGYLEAIKGATPYVPIVVSPRRLVLNEITSINVGKVPDSQRRRRRSQDEARVSTAVA